MQNYKRMKSIFIFFVVIITLLTQQLHAQNKITNPNVLAKHIFKAFKHENFIAYASLIMTESDCEIIINKSTNSDSIKAHAAKFMPSIVKQTRMNAYKDFVLIINDGKKKGINWSKIKLKKILVKSYIIDNIESAGIAIYFEFKKEVFIIDLSNCHRSDSWLMMYNPTIVSIAK